jgi:hypothetical protein
MSNRNRFVRAPAPLTAAARIGAAMAVLGFAALPAAADGKVVVRDLVLTHNVDERMPTDSVDGFAAETDVGFAFVRVSNGGDPTQVKMVWSRNGVEQGSVPLNVGTSSSWRTWSRVSLQPGNWRVQVVNADGSVLSQREFSVGQASVASRPQQQRNDVARQNQDNVPGQRVPQSSQVLVDQTPSDQVGDQNE